MSTTRPRPLTVLVVGAGGYLGFGVCNAFLRATGKPPESPQFRVYGLVRRASAARALAAAEIIPVVGSLDDRGAVCDTLLRHSNVWDVIVTCTEPSHTDPAELVKHWDDVLALVQGLASSSNSAHGVRPFVLWSSGCKDYGMTALHGEQQLVPHTEDSPLVLHPIIRSRIQGALRALEVSVADDGAAGFDVAIVRATPIFGYSASYYAAILEYASATAAASQGDATRLLRLPAKANTIIHGLHLDDCADGYVALAMTALFGGEDRERGRPAVLGQAFNISGRRYETLQEIGAALAAEYGFDGGVEFGVAPDQLPHAVSHAAVSIAFAWSQWVGSDKIRRVTGWTDRRPLFAENLHVYRLAYEAAAEALSDDVDRVRKRLDRWSK